MNFAPPDVSLSGSTTLAYQQTRVTTDNGNGFQRFAFPFPSLDVTFPAPDWILLKVKAMGTSGDHALIAMNATAMPSRLDILTPSYVKVDVFELGDATGPPPLWS